VKWPSRLQGLGFLNQFFCFECKLYSSPFCNRAISLLENDMLLVFMTLGWNVCCRRGVDISVWANLL
jgi:hypothetical protein